METPDTYHQRAEVALHAGETATDPEAKRMSTAAAQRWRQLADIAQRVPEEERKRL